MEGGVVSESESDVRIRCQTRNQKSESDGLFKKQKPKKSDDDLMREWWEWLKKNKGVFLLFESIALEMIESGMRHYSSDGILHVVRYQLRHEISTGRYKINNNYTPCFARYFVRLYPEHSKFFELRKSKVDKPKPVINKSRSSWIRH